MSWFPNSGRKFRGILIQIVRPVLRPFSFAKIGNFNFSAVVAFIVIDYLGSFLVFKLGELL
jgi:uncharacterized protein YggT (Ycf19 family)